MAGRFPWLPIGTRVGGVMAAGDAGIGKVRAEAEGYQLLDSVEADTCVLLIRDTASWLGREKRAWLDREAGFRSVDFEDEVFWSALFPPEDAPFPIKSRSVRPELPSVGEINDIASALVEMSRKAPMASWDEALYLPVFKRCLRTVETDQENRRQVIVRLMTGGIAKSNLSPTQIQAMNPWLTAGEIGEILQRLGLGATAPRSTAPVGAPQEFSLPGRPALERFLREHVIDFFHRREAYEAMGNRPPNGLLVYGPTGSGKSFAVRRLAEFLGWPILDIDLGSIGSPYIHQTSITLKKVFEDAAEKAPAILLMEEIDAMTGDRDRVQQDHKVEEVNQLLRLIEDAAVRGILLIATTNRLEAVDPAILRRGRFDLKVEVGYPNEAEIKMVLESLLEKRPTAPGLNLGLIAGRLARRPMSDIDWLVGEAARQAVRGGKTQIDDICLMGALKALSTSSA